MLRVPVPEFLTISLAPALRHVEMSARATSHWTPCHGKQLLGDVGAHAAHIPKARYRCRSKVGGITLVFWWGPS